jgi:hypothetical protein
VQALMRSRPVRVALAVSAVLVPAAAGQPVLCCAVVQVQQLKREYQLMFCSYKNTFSALHVHLQVRQCSYSFRVVPRSGHHSQHPIRHGYHPAQCEHEDRLSCILLV